MKSINLLMLSLLLWSCQLQTDAVVDPRDYNTYLDEITSSSANTNDEEIRFWSERLDRNSKDEVALSKLAGLYAARFRVSGEIRDMEVSDSLYNHVLRANPEGVVEIYQSLAANAITQHKFRLAQELTEKAISLRDKKAASLLILADVSLEIGDYATARRTLNEFKNKNSFAYLIREMKLKDHEGDLDGAILLMEQAYDRIAGNKALAQWSLSNLADMYGHAGRISEAYRLYLEALKIDPNDDYALKGIAWIAFSADHNSTEAKRIISILASRKRMPEACLMLAEIAGFEGDEMEKFRQLNKFKSLVSSPAYKGMYHKYLAVIEAEEFNNADAGIDIAEAEITNRPTPQSFDLLAWGLYHKKLFSQSLAIAKRNVEGQTFEPEAYYHLGMIYFANGDITTSKYYLKEALKSEFELGPIVIKTIEETLNTI